LKLLGISGSLRRESYNSLLLENVRELVADDVELEVFDGLKVVPPFDEDDEADPAPAVERLRDAIADADAVLFATPEYNSSIPGQLKTAVDWASRPIATAALRNKPVAVVGASTGMFGAVWAQAELRKVLARAGARVLEGELAVPLAASQFDEDGRLRDEELRERLTEVAERLVGETAALSVAA
jgi:chromate reductase